MQTSGYNIGYQSKDTSKYLQKKTCAYSSNLMLI